MGFCLQTRPTADRVLAELPLQVAMDRFATLVEREAGHVVVSLLLIAIGAGLWILKVPKGEDLIPFALGVLGRSMVGKQGGV